MRLPAAVRQVDGMTVQALIAGSLSFAHIHELANSQGQTGWKGWMYPLSVDLLMVAAWSRLRRARKSGEPAGWCWFWFLVALAASLSANVASCGPHPSLMRVAVAVWPAVAFFATTLIGHASARTMPEVVPEPVAVPEPEPEVQTVPEPEAEVAPQPEAEPEAVPDLEAEPVDDLTPRRKRKRSKGSGGIPEDYISAALELMAKHDRVSGTMVGNRIGKSDRYGRMVLAEIQARPKSLPEAVSGTA